MTLSLGDKIKKNFINKLLFRCINLLQLVGIAQIGINNNCKNTINPIFSNFDKSRIQSRILLDHAMEFTEVTAYNGVLTDRT